MTPVISKKWRHAPEGCHAVTGGKNLSVLKAVLKKAPQRRGTRVSKTFGESRRSDDARHFEEMAACPWGCHAVTGGKNLSVLKAVPLERISDTKMQCIIIAMQPVCRIDPFLLTRRVMNLHTEVQT